MGLIDIFSFVLLISTLGYIAYIFINRKKIQKWGNKVLILLAIGLILCSFVVMRDDYVTAMQGGIGVFAIDSFQILSAYFLATIIGVNALSCIIVKNQKYRKNVFMIISFLIIIKTLLIELSRLSG